MRWMQAAQLLVGDDHQGMQFAAFGPKSCQRPLRLARVDPAVGSEFIQNFLDGQPVFGQARSGGGDGTGIAVVQVDSDQGRRWNRWNHSFSSLA